MQRLKVHESAYHIEYMSVYTYVHYIILYWMVPRYILESSNEHLYNIFYKMIMNQIVFEKPIILSL